jgi:hypothetical protein
VVLGMTPRTLTTELHSQTCILLYAKEVLFHLCY